MAYQAKRHVRVQEVLELVDDKGNVVHEINVDLDADAMASKLAKKQIALIHAQKELGQVDKENYDQALESLGKTIIDLFEAVFGENDTITILEFYENKYLEMSQEILPFILNVIIPKVRDTVQENRKNIKSKYNSRQRKFLGRK